MIGLSSIECSNPAERDEKGQLPYGKDLKVTEDNKKKVSDERQLHSGGRSFSPGGLRGSCDGQQGTQDTGKSGGSFTAQGKTKDQEQGATSPLKQQIGKGKTVADVKENVKTGNELTPVKARRQGTKRKQSKVLSLVAEITDQISEGAEIHDAMAIIVADPTLRTERSKNAEENEFILGAEEGDLTKKMKRSMSQSFKVSAEAAAQPRREP